MMRVAMCCTKHLVCPLQNCIVRALHASLNHLARPGPGSNLGVGSATLSKGISAQLRLKFAQLGSIQTVLFCFSTLSWLRLG